MWRAPNDDETDTPRVKADKSAAIRRSAIRREATVRPNRISRDTREPSHTRYRSLRRWHLSLERERRQIDHLEAELDRLRRNRIRMRAEAGLEDEEDLEASDTFRTSTQESHMRTTLLPEPLEPHASVDPHSTLLHGARSIQPSTLPRRYRSSHRPSIPSPPYSQDSRLSPDGLLSVSRGTALTPNFAPARGHHNNAPRSPEGRARVEAQDEPPSDDDLPALETPPPEDWDSSTTVPHGQGAVTRPRRTRIDGLGDRRRSFSQNSSSAEDDTWETLLTTMDEDNPASTTQNSFSSTASYSHRSSQTAATSFGEIGQLDDTCDLDLPQGITEDDARTLRARHENYRALRLRGGATNDTDRDHPSTIASSRHPRFRELREAVWRHNRSALDETPDLLLEHERRNLPTELQRRMDHLEDRTVVLNGFQDILERMQRREEVPRELWASVGLRPVLWENARDAEREALTLAQAQAQAQAQTRAMSGRGETATLDSTEQTRTNA